MYSTSMMYRKLMSKKWYIVHAESLSLLMQVMVETYSGWRRTPRLWVPFHVGEACQKHGGLNNYLATEPIQNVIL